jgi:DNA helicase IV
MSLNLPTYDQLSRDQLDVLTLPTAGSYLITGPPGSGKTVMAILRAQALKREYGEDAILLMYGNLLSQYTQAATAELGVDSTVKTFHSWFPTWYKGVYGKAPDMVDKWTFDWPKIIAVIGTRPAPEQLKKHLIVDEGQDMPKEFFALLRMISKTLTVFADENQTLTEHNSTIREIRAATGITNQRLLTTNYRNTVQIAKVAAHFHQGIQTGVAKVPESTKPGPKPVLVGHPTIPNWTQFLQTYEANNATRNIAVFFHRNKTQWALHYALKGKTRNPTQIYVAGKSTKLDMTKPGIKIISYASAKGLEFDTVFVPGLNGVNLDGAGPTFNMHMYVLASRARRELWFTYHGQGTPAIINRLPLNLLERR